jgi:hypothetical protein
MRLSLTASANNVGTSSPIAKLNSTPLSAARSHQGHAGLEHLGQVDALFDQLYGAGFNGGDVDDVVDQLQQVPAAGQDVAGVFAVFAATQRSQQLVMDDLGEADYRIEPPFPRWTR